MRIKLPNKINNEGTEMLRIYAQIWLPKFSIRNAPRIYMVDQARGYCDYRGGYITVPMWVINQRGEDGLQEYLIHELSHWKDYEKRGVSDHGPNFWEIFMEVCPPQWWHWEESYKPRMFKNMAMGLLDLFNDKGEPNV